MRLSIDRERFKIFLWIALWYLALWTFGEMLAHPETFFKRTWNNIWLISYLVVLNFIALEYAIPYIRLTWQRLLVAPFLLFALSMLYSFAFYGWRALGIGLHAYFPLVSPATTIEGVRTFVPYSFASILFFTLFRHVYDYRLLKRTAEQLRLEKQEAELNYLRSQTNPHFLFNTLNNIYSLARDKSDRAPESILRLSKILRFMLYETSGAYIAIEQEIKIIEDYISLEQLRYDESLVVNFNHDVENMKQSIPPLLLIPLVENAFKHGVSETRGKPFVDIHLSVNNRVLHFNVKNSTDSGDEVTSIRENIGLSNLRRQLALLYREYSLLVQPAEGTFTTTLKINLASHV